MTQIAATVLSMTYGLLTAVASGASLANRTLHNALASLGIVFGLSVSVAGFLLTTELAGPGVVLLVVGLLGIILTAIGNGYYLGSPVVSHHIVRILISAAITALAILGLDA